MAQTKEAALPGGADRASVPVAERGVVHTFSTARPKVVQISYRTWEQKSPQPTQYLVSIEAKQHYIVRFLEKANTFLKCRFSAKKQGLIAPFRPRKSRET
jgi:hypothetical protein